MPPWLQGPTSGLKSLMQRILQSPRATINRGCGFATSAMQYIHCWVRRPGDRTMPLLYAPRESRARAGPYRYVATQPFDFETLLSASRRGLGSDRSLRSLQMPAIISSALQKLSV